MIRIALFILASLLPLAAAAQERLSDKALNQLRVTADQIAAIEPGRVPDILLRAIIAAEQRDHLSRAAANSRVTRQLASMHLGAMPSLRREAAEDALSAFLGERMSPADIARVYASVVYFGRNCYGYRNAVQGLARRTADRADETVWLALAALPRSPSFYLRDRSALRARVSRIIADMRAAGLVDSAEAERLDSLPLADVDIGPGCSS